MKTLSGLADKELVRAIDERWNDSSSLWERMKQWSDLNIKYWTNDWEDPLKSARKVSRAKDNRIFLSMEHDVNILTGRPAKPVVVPVDDSDINSAKVAQGLQSIFLELYRTRQVKKKLKKGVRHLHLYRLICLYPFWNNKINDVDVRLVDPKKVRIPKNANNEEEAEWVGEEIEEPIQIALETKFSDVEDAVLKAFGVDENRAVIVNPKVKYQMFWTDDMVVYKFQGTILKRLQNPTWDWQGLVVETNEQLKLNELKGKLRRPFLEEVKQSQTNRTVSETNEEGVEETKRRPGTFFFNHFDRPRKPYIFGTILEFEDGPLGSTDLIHQSASLQDNINRRKRQIEDNSEEASGIFLFDSKTFSREDVQKFSARAGSRLYGSNIERGFRRDTGRELPSFVFNDLEHSIRELDNIWATQGIVRGEREGKETATGRAILREASLERRDEAVDLMDFVSQELYNWWYQLMKLNYTELHYVKPLGFERTERTIDLMQDDFEDGISIKIIPGQVVPEDKIFKIERAQEEVNSGLLSPLDYHREVGKEDPEGITKRLILFKANPAALIQLSEQEKEQLLVGQEKNVRDIRQSGSIAELEQFLRSDEFQQLPVEEQQRLVGRVRQQIDALKRQQQ
ncbi:hypothetical protein HY496_01475 [Candidatus Woesearchaeota archaeon]|nr:hypothetical protein [Candidatus Woesearchaeota archaeon]